MRKDGKMKSVTRIGWIGALAVAGALSVFTAASAFSGVGVSDLSRAAGIVPEPPPPAPDVGRRLFGLHVRVADFQVFQPGQPIELNAFTVGPGPLRTVDARFHWKKLGGGSGELAASIDGSTPHTSLRLKALLPTSVQDNPTEWRVWATATVVDKWGRRHELSSRDAPAATHPDGPSGDGDVRRIATADFKLAALEFTDSHPAWYPPAVGEPEAFTVPLRTGLNARRHWELLSRDGVEQARGPYELLRTLGKTANLKLTATGLGSGRMTAGFALVGRYSRWKGPWNAAPILRGGKATAVTPALWNEIRDEPLALRVKPQIRFSDYPKRFTDHPKLFGFDEAPRSGPWAALKPGGRELTFATITDFGPVTAGEPPPHKPGDTYSDSNPDPAAP